MPSDRGPTLEYGTPAPRMRRFPLILFWFGMGVGILLLIGVAAVITVGMTNGFLPAQNDSPPIINGSAATE